CRDRCGNQSSTASPAPCPDHRSALPARCVVVAPRQSNPKRRIPRRLTPTFSCDGHYRFLTLPQLPRIVAGSHSYSGSVVRRRQMKTVRRMLICAVCVLAAASASAQVQTGSIVGAATDASNAVMPGVTVSVSGDRLIGGVQTQVTDSSGAYRFDRLPPGAYSVKFELQGFKTVTRDGIQISASFVATVNAKMEVGSVSETITVTGESPTVDTRSNLQQTVMTQAILEGVPSGRDPWSVAKIIPGVQVSTYDVGGTQSFQQSNLSAHGSSTNHMSFNMRGPTAAWPAS